ncbi:MAG: RNA methyltransferase [Magnetospirillum sp.]|nr:RNA methyltransferase [Magnetospirillum sp.]
MARYPRPHRSQPAVPDTERVTGLPAVAALFANDPARVERLFYDDRIKPQVGPFCSLLAAHRKPYRLVKGDELAKIAGTQLHGGIVAIARLKPVPAFDLDEARLWAAARQPLLLLDGVSNPHNLGAIARTMAFFGMERLVVSDHPGQALPSDAALRVAEGGLEWLTVYRAPRFPTMLKQLGQHYRVVGTALGQGRPLEAMLAEGGQPLAVVLGNEEHGLPPATLAACEELATIAGSGRVQSLNVAATAAIVIHALAARKG